MSPRRRARQAAQRLDFQLRSTCHLLRQLSESLEALGDGVYERYTGGGYYDALIERYARMLTADIDGRCPDGFLNALLHTMPPKAQPQQPAATIDSLLPA